MISFYDTKSMHFDDLLSSLIDKYDNVDLNKIGFPADWDSVLSQL